MSGTEQHQFLGPDGQAHDPLHFVFPILKYFPREERYQAVGTGFFVGMSGMFVTARHVIMELIEKDETVGSFLVAGHFLPDGTLTLRQIQRFFLHNTADIAVGFMKPTAPDGNTFIFNHGVTITMYWPTKGQVVRSISFPNTLCLGHKTTEVIACDAYHVTEHIQALYKNGRDRRVHPSPVFEAVLQTHGGASGGPVIDENGLVFGVISSGLGDITYVTPISEIMDIVLEGMRFSTNGDMDLTMTYLADRNLLGIEAAELAPL